MVSLIMLGAYQDARPAREGAKPKVIGWCTEQMMCVREGFGADQLVNDGGDATLALM